jgi:isopenicillin-N N-acyltransferase-like protein
MATHRYRRIRASGGTWERSVAYGVAAKEEITRTIDGYKKAFALRGISWDHATQIAQGFVDDVVVWRPELMTEIEGIASGSGHSVNDIFTINCRTEVLWWAAVNDAKRLGPPSRGECTSIALHPQAQRSQGVLVGQNWDWLEGLSDTVVVVEVERDDGPNYVTIVEAGLLAKTTLTQAGLAVAINTLVCSLDGTPGGIPFHFLIRAVVESATVADALDTLSTAGRASSGNYVLGSATGEVLNIETAPGDAGNVFPLSPTSGGVVHANHFLHAIDGGVDLAPAQMPDSYGRHTRMDTLVGDNPNTVSLDDIKKTLADHTGYPSSVCCHPDPQDGDDSWATLYGVIMDPKARNMYLSEGNPCQADWQEISYADLLGSH